MLREAHIHVPVLFNDGTPISEEIQATIQTEIVYNLARGYTITPVHGYWEGMEEPMHRYTIALPYATLEQQASAHHALNTLATLVKRECEQEAVYVVYPNGNAELR